VLTASERNASGKAVECISSPRWWSEVWNDI